MCFSLSPPHRHGQFLKFCKSTLKGILTMNKHDLITAVANRHNAQLKDIEPVLDTLADVVREELAKGNEVTLHGLGKFKVSQRKARTGRNPSTGEPMQIPAKTTASFTAAKALKDAVNTA